LAAADLGIAMGAAGSDSALEVADVALLGDDLSKVPYLLNLGRRTMRVVRSNIVAAIAVKLTFAVLVFPGLVTLWMAVAIGDMGVSLGVILNALRLTRVK
jgi:Cd2+/Zn2+-exporting ATPase